MSPGNERAEQPPLESLWAVAAHIPCPQRVLWDGRTFVFYFPRDVYSHCDPGANSLPQVLLRKTKSVHGTAHLYYFLYAIYYIILPIIAVQPYSYPRHLPQAELQLGFLMAPRHSRHGFPRSARHFVLFNRRLTANSASKARLCRQIGGPVAEPLIVR